MTVYERERLLFHCNAFRVLFLRKAIIVNIHENIYSWVVQSILSGFNTNKVFKFSEIDFEKSKFFTKSSSQILLSMEVVPNLLLSFDQFNH